MPLNIKGNIIETTDITNRGVFTKRVNSDGLVFCLDSGDLDSYPGSGTVWYDLSGNGSNVSLGGVVYDSASGGNMVFDGTSTDYIDFFAPNLTTTTTVEVWAKLGSVTSNMIFGWLLYDLYCSGGAMGYNTASSDVYGLTSTQVTNLGILNNWKQFVFEMRSDITYTNNKIYVNGVLQSTSQVAASEASGNRNFNSGNGRISGWRNDTGYRMPMNLSIFRVYNRALNPYEISENFQANRGRFGI